MPPLRNVPRRQVLAALKSLGFVELGSRGKGSHIMLAHAEDASRRTTLPRRDPVATGTLRGMLKDAGVSRAEFEAALARK